MAESFNGIVDTTQEYGKAGAPGGDGFFPSAEELSKQQWKEICTKLNDVVSIMGKNFEVCKDLNDKSGLHLRIDCEGMDKKVVSEFRVKLKGCGLNTQSGFQPLNSNLGFLGPNSGYIFITVSGLRKGKTFEVSPALSEFAENHPKRNACCNIL
jgi:hypothetical protein